MSETDPTKPTPNGEKFKPENVTDPRKAGGPPEADPDKPADTGGRDLQRGSEPAIRNSSNNRG